VGHNFAAFAGADVRDAKRGRPDFDLRGWAAQRGLEFFDHMTMAGFRSAMAGEEEWQHNVTLGTLPGGGYGVVVHDALAIDYSHGHAGWDGTFVGVKASTGKFRFRDLIPVVSDLTSTPETPPLRVPTTVAAVQAREPRGVLPALRIDTRKSAPPYDFGERRSLDAHGLDGWFVRAEVDPPPGVLESLLAPPIPEMLRAHAGDGLFQVVSWYGTLLVRRNGYLRDPGDLDELAQVASLLGARLCEACAPLAEPRPFEERLPPPAWTSGGAVSSSFKPVEPWPQWMLSEPGARGLTLEDPEAYHRALPRVPVPGLAHVVMRGELPGFGDARLVVHFEERSARPAVVAAAPGVEDTPPGGLRYSDRGCRAEAADGTIAVWSTTSYWGNAMAGDLDEFLTRAASVAREAFPAAAR
jgi:hypothetical protein